MSKNPLPSLFGKSGRAAERRDEVPIREELYSVERMEQYAGTLAAEHQVFDAPRRGRSLLPRLEENGRQLVAAYQALAGAIREELSISPAAEWLVDNFHIVEEQLREVREDLPAGFYRELPKLTNTEMAGYPRIYALSIEFIAHTDSRLDTETLTRFIRAYQRTAPLTIGELWAVAITLRLALVENLRRLASRIVAAREAREEADAVADQLLEIAERQPANLISLLAGRLGQREDLDRAFVVQLTQRLRDQDPSFVPVFDWLDRQLQRRGQSTEQIVHIEHQRQAAAQVTVGNVITSMRLLSTLDWHDFFESVSLLEPILGEDPAGVYLGMNFATRDRYRHVIERVSKRTRATELEVARESIRLAAASQGVNPADVARTHVGYYLIDDGASELERQFAYRPYLYERALCYVRAHPTLFYLGTLTLMTALVVALLVIAAYAMGAGWAVLVSFAILSLIPASDLAVSVLNWDVTHLIAPRLLPSMESEDGIPSAGLTMVVVPTLFTSEAGVRELLEKLEVQHLANRDENLYFALLGDFSDAAQEELDADATLLELAFSGIEELNARHSGGGSGGDGAKRFHLFMRRRL
ncbi:MAG: cyclic beta 1-2 glucan synthetase, partial [Rubrivivax sp.]|nr:cyclic beta 1-2 glucan synthetase [Pyrinomonadaceae bacterium]